MTLKLITDAATEPISLSEARLFLKIDSDATDEDDLITDMIQTARENCEHELGGQSLLLQTWEVVLDAFPAAEIELGMPSVTPIGSQAAIESITYIDTNGDSQTLSSSLYTIDADSPPGWVLPAVDTTWPATMDCANAVRVRYTMGSALASSLPKSIKSWMLLRIRTLYEFRKEFVCGTVVPLPDRFHCGLLDRYRRWVV